MAVTANPGSLQNLHDIALPQTVGWWPLAPGWYVLTVVLVLAAAAWSLRAWRRYSADRYRREALAELERLRRDMRQDERRSAALAALPVLLKRAALAAYPRTEIAPLSGMSWRCFLDTSSSGQLFADVAGETLLALAYGNSAARPLEQAEIDALCSAIEFWLRNHRVPLN